MMRRILVGTLVLVLVTTPASAQFAVIDPANLAQAILIVQRTQRHLEELRAQYRTIVRMAQGLGRLDQYRIPPSALTGHDSGRWAYGRQPEHVIEAITGHLSRRMLEHYSHQRLKAKGQMLTRMEERRKTKAR